MTDIVTRLLNQADWLTVPAETMRKAAKEINSLRGDVSRVSDALGNCGHVNDELCREIAQLKDLTARMGEMLLDYAHSVEHLMGSDISEVHEILKESRNEP